MCFKQLEKCYYIKSHVCSSVSEVSPSSVDGWPLYSGGSPSSSTHGECSSSEDASSSSISTFDLLTSTPVKRNRTHTYQTETEEEDEDEELTPPNAGVSMKRPKRSISGMDIPSVPIRKARPVPGSADPQVDVRMIDFAHTTFSGCTPVHHGPDCGFLTGLDSLKRLLTEILSEENDL